MLDQTLAQLMQRLLERDAPSTPLSATARRLLDDLGIGRILGKTMYLSERDRQEMRELLLARGYSITPSPLKDMSRSERLAEASPNEKAGGGAVKTGRVSIKALPDKTLAIAGRTLLLPDGSHVDIDWRMVLEEIGHDAIILVENYEVFDQIHRLRLELPSTYANALVLYRGDRMESRLDNVKAFLEATDMPVIAFPDIDPKGLHIAGTCPRLAGVLAPEQNILERVLGSPATSRHDLFRNQLPGAGGYLRAVPTESPVAALWSLVQKHRAGCVQERWLADQITCKLWIKTLHPTEAGDDHDISKRSE